VGISKPKGLLFFVALFSNLIKFDQPSKNLTVKDLTA
jgi:threonine/homoserine/homoserine lactone efflux protein